MPRFFYKAKKGPQEIVEDYLQAENLEKAIEIISSQGNIPIDVQLSPEKRSKNVFPSKTFFRQKVNSSNLVQLTRQFADLVDAGLPLLRVLKVCREQTRDPQLQKVLDRMFTIVQDGGSFSKGLEAHPEVFSSLYVNMVRSGEMSGQLRVVLERLAFFLEKDFEVRAKIQSSLVYPAFILGVGVMTIFVLLTFVIPRLTEMFDELSAELPLPTVLLMNISGFFAKFWWIVVLGGLGVVYAFMRLLRTPEGRLMVDEWCLKIPVVNQFIKNAEVARFARTLATVLESGVVIVQALDATEGVVTSEVLKKDIKSLSQQVASGTSLTEALTHCSFFPPVAAQMISVGEEAGKLDGALYKLAISFEKKADQSTRTLTSLLEPVLIVVIGLVVGFVVVSMLLPIFQMNLMIN